MLKRTIFILVCLLLIAVPVFAQDELPNTVNLSSSDTLGQYLVGPNGMTLYMFTPDPLDASACSGRCPTNWPPLTVESADAVTAPEGLPGELGTITREDDGTLQVTYNGMPLYYYVEDHEAGDVVGQGVGGKWWVVPPAVVYLESNEELGQYLVGPTGMTLYLFTRDTFGSGESTCYTQCAQNWPALTVADEDAELIKGFNLPGELGTIERTDGTYQVTYNGIPLYYWAKDEKRGDTTGEGVGDVWYVVSPETVSVSSSADLGDFLTAQNGMTLYTFSNDTEGVSNCSGQCLENWPAYTVTASDQLKAGAGIDGELGTITRDDGTLQVTYNGMPLYFFHNDHAVGDTAGQGVGDVWWVVSPSGEGM